MANIKVDLLQDASLPLEASLSRALRQVRRVKTHRARVFPEARLRSIGREVVKRLSGIAPGVLLHFPHNPVALDEDLPVHAGDIIFLLNGLQILEFFGEQ